MAVAVRQKGPSGNFSGATPLELTFAEAVKAGSLLLLSVVPNKATEAEAPISVSDNVNGSWTKISAEPYGQEHAQIWAIITAAGTPTVKVPKPVNFSISGAVFEVTGGPGSLSEILIAEADKSGLSNTTSKELKTEVTATAKQQLIIAVLAGHSNTISAVEIHVGEGDVGEAYEIVADVEPSSANPCQTVAMGVTKEAGKIDPYFTWTTARNFREQLFILKAGGIARTLTLEDSTTATDALAAAENLVLSASAAATDAVSLLLELPRFRPKKLSAAVRTAAAVVAKTARALSTFRQKPTLRAFRQKPTLSASRAPGKLSAAARQQKTKSAP